jgi:multidrug efflux system membrane fusion protein
MFPTQTFPTLRPADRRRQTTALVPLLLRFTAAIWLGTVAGCDPSPDPAAPSKTASAAPVPVLVATVAKKTVPVQVPAVGNVEAYATVAVKARVDGQIQRVFFTEGQEVAAGSPLFLIDPRPFLAQLEQAEANLARDQAQLENARLQERRYLDLIKKKLASEDQYDRARTAREAAEASVRADRAAIQNAKLQIEYSNLRAPIGGLAGRVLIQQGNLVKANDSNPLVVINQVDPIYVSCSVPEQYLIPVRRAMAAGTTRLQVTLPGTDLPPLAGKPVFLDNAVDPETGTIRIKALFQNPEGVLWPGQFVSSLLVLREQSDAIVVPSQALQSGPKGQYVFVVGQDRKAELRSVRVERTVGPDAVVAAGVAPGEQVVTVGQWRLRPGSTVDPKSGAATS